MQVALDSARKARLHILGEMNKVLSSARPQMSEWAPTIITMKIDPEKIREVIGKGGAVIRAITEETGTDRHRERRSVKIASVSGAAAARPSAASNSSCPTSRSARSTRARSCA
jgi:polyribonucleotide nucleotidyltransferase